MPDLRCSIRTVTLGILAVGMPASCVSTVTAQDEAPASADADATKPAFRTVIKRGSVDLDAEYNLNQLSIPLEQIHRLLPKDAIPALTDPPTELASDATWLSPDARIVVVTVGQETLAVPLLILDRHEIVNARLANEPIAITYCPLCDSATVFSRQVMTDGKDNSASNAKLKTLEFGVSGALFNSNVLMFDRTTNGLWSQLGMRCVSGPLAGTSLRMLKFQVVSNQELLTMSPDTNVVSRDTDRKRKYSPALYGKYFQTDRLIVPVKNYGTQLPRKTLGVGISVGEESWFLPRTVIGDRYVHETPIGKIELASSDSGVSVLSKPESARVAQTFYYSWSAFYPEAKVIRSE